MTAIERDAAIMFEPEGTVKFVTSWITEHDAGMAEWLKNSRRAYQADRAAVKQEQWAVAILMADSKKGEAPRIGLLDVGGATADDLKNWSEWQNLRASGMMAGEEVTQGNGGKAYMYKLFKGPATILGVRNGKLNRKGFIGPQGAERATPGYIPSVTAAKEATVPSFIDLINDELRPFNLTFDALPQVIREAITERQAFTLVQGIDPYKINKRIPAGDLVRRIVAHPQAELPMQQLKVFAVQNGVPLNEGGPLQQEPIEPYVGFEDPLVIPMPEELEEDDGTKVSTTKGGTLPAGTLTLRTSKTNMFNAYKTLRHRWTVTYRAGSDMIGSKPLSEVVPIAPMSQHVYAFVDLPALSDCADAGRKRPIDEPLVRAVDRFVAEWVRELARRIYVLQRNEKDQASLDEISSQNKMLDQWKNRFLGTPAGGDEGPEGPEGPGGPPPVEPPTVPVGDIPITVTTRNQNGLVLPRGLSINLENVVKPVARDEVGAPVRCEFEWLTDNPSVVLVENMNSGTVRAVGKGSCAITVKVKGTAVASAPIGIKVVVVSHVSQSPRSLTIPVGTMKKITAEVTTDDGESLTTVLLKWKHDAEDPATVRIHPKGMIYGLKIGRTNVLAGVDDPDGSGTWATIGTEVAVTENLESPSGGEGYPRLLITDKDIDPLTNEIREGDPGQPSLWQDVFDQQKNIWWLNLQAPDAEFAYSMRETAPEVWRMFHASKLCEMVSQVKMASEYTMKQEDENPEYWSVHKQTMENIQVGLYSSMWEGLKEWVNKGGDLN